MQCYSPYQHLLHSDFEDFKNGVCHVIKIAVAEINPGMGLVIPQTVCWIPDVLARDSKVPTPAMSKASDRGQNETFTCELMLA